MTDTHVVMQGPPGANANVRIKAVDNGDGTHSLATSEIPDASSSSAPSNAEVTAYVASKIITAVPGKLYGMSGYNAKTSAQFIQLHNAAALPADTAVPVVTFKIEAQSPFSLDYGNLGRFFSVGIVVCNSSTGPTKTIGSADCWFDAQYA